MSFTPSPAQVVLSDVFGLYGKELTDLETTIWNGMIKNFGDEPVIKFLIRHAETSVFAPKPAEALKMLRPGANNALAAYEELTRAVGSCGPYASPTFEDSVIAGAVVLMGGWIKVNETMPDPTNRFDSEAFFKRFEVLYEQSRADLMMGRSQPVQLQNLHQRTAQQALLLANQREQMAQIGYRVSDEPLAHQAGVQ